MAGRRFLNCRAAPNRLPQRSLPYARRNASTNSLNFARTSFRSANVGGSFRYYLAVDTAFDSDAEKIETRVSLEYKAAFVSASAEAKAEWETLSKHWTESRKVSISAEGGDTGTLDALRPDYGDSDSTAFQKWQSQIAFGD